jgi:hypothetical protein
LRITYFQAEKLYNVGGGRTAAQRQSSPYRVTTYRGPELGLLGSLPAALHRRHDINLVDAANQEEFAPTRASLLQKIRNHYSTLCQA